VPKQVKVKREKKNKKGKRYSLKKEKIAYILFHETQFSPGSPSQSNKPAQPSPAHHPTGPHTVRGSRSITRVAGSKLLSSSTPEFKLTHAHCSAVWSLDSAERQPRVLSPPHTASQIRLPCLIAWAHPAGRTRAHPDCLPACLTASLTTSLNTFTPSAIAIHPKLPLNPPSRCA
jgi:hypothetical protein